MAVGVEADGFPGFEDRVDEVVRPVPVTCGEAGAAGEQACRRDPEASGGADRVRLGSAVGEVLGDRRVVPVRRVVGDHELVSARASTGLAKLAVCQPSADSLENVTVASSVPFSDHSVPVCVPVLALDL